MYFASLSQMMRDLWFFQTTLGHNNQKWRNSYPSRRGNYCSKLKRGKLKTKSLLTRKVMNKSPQYNQQTEPKQCNSEVEEINMYSPIPGN